MRFARQELASPVPLEDASLPGSPGDVPAAFPLHPALGPCLRGHAGDDRAERNRELLSRGKAQVVVTGQQPCFPLPLGLTLMKAASAVAIASSLSRRLGSPVVPLFWIGGDDHDFEEARGQKLFRVGRDPLRVSLALQAERRGGFVGDLPVAEACEELLALPGLSPGPADWPPAAGEDLAAREGRILAQLFAPWGLLTLDARENGVREASAPLFHLYGQRRRDFALRIDEAGNAIEVETGRRPLRKGIGERALFFLRKRRRSLPESNEYSRRLGERLERDPASLAPNVALRPLAQDRILPVVAAVLGPSEWEYHRQLRQVFDLMELPFPAAVPRLSVSLPEDGVERPSEREGSPLAERGNPLADPGILVEAAESHLREWEDGHFGRLVYEGE